MQEDATNNTGFVREYSSYKSKIDIEIKQYCKHVISLTKKELGEYPAEVVAVFCEILSRGGKRLRGVLAMNSYYMFGGKDEGVAIKAGLAIEMLQAYILIADDIQDRSDFRRGGQSAHKLLESYHRGHKLRGESGHFGVSVAINALLYGVHSSLNIISELPIGSGYKISAIKSINYNFIKTSHGQSLDIFNEVIEDVTEKDIDKVMLLKTAYYTFLNPLQLGGILAGANEKEIKKLEGYAFNAGRAFQIQNDIDAIFGSQEATGKSPYEDIKEGKRNIITLKAQELASKQDTEFLKGMLGNRNLTDKDFVRVQEIIEECGALDYAQNQAEISAKEALSSLNPFATGDSGSNEVEFLKILIQHISSSRL